jgi:hypothetical protein
MPVEVVPLQNQTSDLKPLRADNLSVLKDSWVRKQGLCMAPIRLPRQFAQPCGMPHLYDNDWNC